MMPAPRLCLIEDDPIMGESLCDRFALERLEHDWFRDIASAGAALRTREYAVVVSDIRLRDGTGDALFESLRAEGVAMPPWLFITAFGAIDRAVGLLKQGAADYITKPFDLDVLVERLQGYLEPMVSDAAGERLGVSPVMRHLAGLLPRLARHATTMLITGESGVGKEVVARELHRLGEDAGAPFVAVNCGGLSESLLEAELFGHEKGAFTGALQRRPGVFEQAHGGTLFLDEIGDMPLAMQVKLLRVLQDRQVTRVGGSSSREVDFRLICATHRDLRAEVQAGRFREDLFYRIHVIHLRIPPLRERRDDIPWLARRFLAEAGGRGGEPVKHLSPQVEQALLTHEWPGNVRELKNAIERACVLSAGDQLMLEALFDDVITGPVEVEGFGSADLHGYLRACERGYIEKALAANEGRITITAEALGISRKNLWERMKRLGIPALEPDKG
ncbi:Fis family two component sigma-54 specific transcriptional regulator - like protein [Thioalkalivibrio nitratireducens DSM 14787]|uniref:Fis family two component sigma-54 specific transcriptional regulator-like protein n=1 Tax=Thioalkalivibrio nitratireducens (strain DSM 14787 / UNIQEM 213 / ALEN2) TaxID=1255043 RepID=L0DWA3_THIND|nr:sigma-54 dependent transcriptional regulator [Thioalkalivibrio nitratireducens]AGA32641.1 Fis family two component sigma-54 specific transcriptional regulator - like protein [Thioalkalivibrio nitratireducens DSM 14787]